MGINVYVDKDSPWMTSKGWVGVPKQDASGNDCGVFLIRYIACDLHGIPYDRISWEKQAISRYREYIRHDLRYSKVDQTNVGRSLEAHTVGDSDIEDQYRASPAQISEADLKTLEPGMQLNDEVVNGMLVSDLSCSVFFKR